MSPLSAEAVLRGDAAHGNSPVTHGMLKWMPLEIEIDIDNFVLGEASALAVPARSRDGKETSRAVATRHAATSNARCRTASGRPSSFCRCKKRRDDFGASRRIRLRTVLKIETKRMDARFFYAPQQDLVAEARTRRNGGNRLGRS